MARPLSSLDAGYLPGYLSVYPAALDDTKTLYEARNNATTQLKQSLPYNSKQIILVDGGAFPSHGLVRIGPAEGSPGKVVVPDGGQLVIGANEVQAGNAELVYYGSRVGDVLTDLSRGFAGSRQGTWAAGAFVTNGVMAEHHNAVKDALLNLEDNLGVAAFPRAASLNGILTELERKFLAPKPIFRSFPLRGAPPLKVRFQNYSGGDPIKYLWEFGDGTMSSEQSPVHTYVREGVYSVKLNVITSLGAQGIATKSNYITVSGDQGVAFFYSERVDGTSVNTSGDGATVFAFVDQSDGAVVQRIWDFADGERLTVDDPDVHTASHRYSAPGTYDPTLLVFFESQQFKRVFMYDQIEVT